jgi:hypothetical protein
MLTIKNGHRYDDEGKCDICGITVNKVIVLRKERFTNKAPSLWKNNVNRVCFRCALDLNCNNEYDFGAYWREFLLGLKMRRRIEVIP